MLRIGVTTWREDGKFIFQLVICLTITPGLPEPRKRELEGMVRLGEEETIKLSAPLFDMSWMNDFSKAQGEKLLKSSSLLRFHQESWPARKGICFGVGNFWRGEGSGKGKAKFLTSGTTDQEGNDFGDVQKDPYERTSEYMPSNQKALMTILNQTNEDN